MRIELGRTPREYRNRVSIEQFTALVVLKTAEPALVAVEGPVSTSDQLIADSGLAGARESADEEQRHARKDPAPIGVNRVLA